MNNKEKAILKQINKAFEEFSNVGIFEVELLTYLTPETFKVLELLKFLPFEVTSDFANKKVTLMGHSERFKKLKKGDEIPIYDLGLIKGEEGEEDTLDVIPVPLKPESRIITDLN